MFYRTGRIFMDINRNFKTGMSCNTFPKIFSFKISLNIAFNFILKT
jgi:hypothetical protein